VFESALTVGGEALRRLGSNDEEVDEIIESVRERDRQRFAAQLAGDLQSGRGLLLSNAVQQARESGAVAAPSPSVAIAPDVPETPDSGPVQAR
jgi:glutathione-regulated potassium-efflux system protein KefB